MWWELSRARFSMTLLLVACGGGPSPSPSKPSPLPIDTAVVTAPPPNFDAGGSANRASIADAEPDRGSPSSPNDDESPTKAHDPWPLSTPCVDVVADAKKRSKSEFLSMEPQRVDIDMDGVKDWVVTTDADSTEYRGYVYLARGACGHFAGAWTGSSPAPSADGKEYLTTKPCKVDCCNGTSTRYVWDGKTYVKRGTVKNPTCAD